MEFLSLTIFALNIFLIISILLQEDQSKNSSLAIENTNFFSNELEKITFIVFIMQFLLLLSQLKVNFL